MSETHTDFFVFWWHCIKSGWEFGYGIFDAFVTVCLLASAGSAVGLWLLKKFKPKKWKWKPWEDTVMKVAFVVFAISFLIVAGLVGPFREYHEMENKVNDDIKTVDSLSRSNSYLNGQIQGEDKMVSTLQKQLDDNKRDSETALLNSKTDLNEANRQKDAALQRLDFFEANPEKLSNIYSNIFAQTPTNFQQFYLAFQQYTNALTGIAQQPVLELRVNGQTNLISTEVAVGESVIVRNFIRLDDRQVRITVANLSKKSAINGFVYFLTDDLDPTNIVADGWKREPDDGGKRGWRYDATQSIVGNGTWLASTIHISTNFAPGAFYFQFALGADNAATKSYFIQFVVPK